MNLADLAQQFATADQAREHLEKVRWPEDVFCPKCGLSGESYRLTAKPGSKTPVRKGVWKCGGCRKQFTVTVGTIFEDSHIPLHKWLFAIHLLCASKKGMSAHQLHRMLGVTYKSAWFMAHRIRYAMSQEPLASQLSGVVEADETYIGGKFRNSQPQAVKAGERAKDRRSPVDNKQAVFSVLQRGGRVQSRHIERVTGTTLKGAIKELCAEDAHVMTDSAAMYSGLKSDRKHSIVNHKQKEYVRYEDGICVTTNTIEGFFANLKRGVNGTYHHWSKQHLHRYLSEFDFRYNARHMNDGDRANAALKGFEGKRLMMKDPKSK
jgi:transposase-like protein